MKCGAFELLAPADHPFARSALAQPLRDLCVGIAAEHIGRKYPDSTLVDVGANIGDTAAIMATYARNRMILIEGSEYYFDFLQRNARSLPNEFVLRKAFVSDGATTSGAFDHLGGTARFRESASSPSVFKTQRLDTLCDDRTSFIKLDTDGFDVRILSAALDWLAIARPALLFENQILDRGALDSVNQLLQRLNAIGYCAFIVWDDPGVHMVSTKTVQTLLDLNRYLFNSWHTSGKHRIANYDVLCLHERDADLYDSLSEWWRNN